MKDLKDALIEHNSLLKQQKRKLCEYVAELVEINYDTKGLYKEQFKEINYQIQEALRVFDEIINKNEEIMRVQDFPYIMNEKKENMRLKKKYKEN